MPYLAMCLLSAREADITILDGVFNDIKDDEAFAAQCAQGAAMGFDGKTLIRHLPKAKRKQYLRSRKQR